LPRRLTPLVFAVCFAALLISPSLSGVAYASGTASISGTVYDASNAAITTGDICVYAEPTANGGSFGSAQTDASGHYTIPSLSAGSYYVSFEDCTTSTRNDVMQYYGGASDLSDSEQVTLTAGQSQVGVNATLAAGTSITGHVYGGSGAAPLNDACVDAYGNDTTSVADTGSDGSYVIGHLAPGDAYTIEFSPCGNSLYAPQYYNDVTDSSQATTVTPTLAQPATGVDATLFAGATISGTVSDASGPITTGDICISAELDSAGSEFFGEVHTDANGNYTLPGLDPGSYRLQFGDCGGSARNDVPQYYEGSGSSQDTQGFHEVSVTAGGSQTGINATLLAGTSISGHVYGGSTSTPLGDACVSAGAGNNGGGSATTGSDGSYTISHIPPGLAYTVSFQPCDGSSYAKQYYSGAASSAQATPVTPTVAQPATGIDAVLTSGASISGTVYDAGGEPITTGGICVEAVPTSAGADDGTAEIDANGNYTVSGLSPGNYRVNFSDCDGSTRNDLFQYYVSHSSPPYGGTLKASAATTITLTSQGTRTGVDIALAAATSISGTVYGGSGTSNPLQDICVGVQLVNESTSGPNTTGSATTDASGHYTINRLAPSPSAYYVTFSDCNTPATYTYAFYNSGGAASIDRSTATPVEPTAADPATDIDANLRLGGSITGRIEDSTGTPIAADVCVRAELNPEPVDSLVLEDDDTGVTPDGYYTLNDVVPGSYTVGLSDCDDARNDVSEQLTSDVAVTSGSTATAPTIELQPGTTISGTVNGCSQASTSLSNSQVVYGCGGSQTPLASVCVYADTSSVPSDLASPNAETRSDGTYTLKHVNPGASYTVDFDPCSYPQDEGYEEQYYDNVSSASLATPVISTLADPATNVNASLPYGAPVGTITGGPANGAATSATVDSFSFHANIAGATFRCSLDGGPYRGCSSPHSTGTLTAGSHTFSVEALAGGQTEIDPPSVTWTVSPSSTTSTSQGLVSGGQTFSSDPGATPSPTVPVVVGVTPPAGSRVTVTTEPASTASGNGYTIFGEQIDIAAAGTDGTGTVTGTANAPIALTFAIAPSEIPAGTDLNTLTVTRDGSPAADCASSGVASPDPCVQNRSVGSDGSVTLTVLTTHCSTWNFAVMATAKVTTTTTATTTTTTTTTATTATTTSTTTHPAPVATPSRATVMAALNSTLAPKGSKAKITDILKHGFGFSFAAPSAGRLVVDWYYLPADARLPKVHSKKAKQPKAELVGSVSSTVRRSGATKVTVKLTGTGHKLLRAARSMKLTSYAAFTPTRGTLTSEKKSFTLKR
jgi:hypothetical protein